MWVMPSPPTEQRCPRAFLYVDDTTLVNTVPMSQAVRHCSTTEKTVKSITVLKLESSFHDLEKGACDIGMRTNKKKGSC